MNFVALGLKLLFCEFKIDRILIFFFFFFFFFDLFEEAPSQYSYLFASLDLILEYKMDRLTHIVRRLPHCLLAFILKSLIVILYHTFPKWF